MKTTATFLIFYLASSQAFKINLLLSSFRRCVTTPLNACVPSGLSPDEYRQIKAIDQRKAKGKNIGALDPKKDSGLVPCNHGRRHTSGTTKPVIVSLPLVTVKQRRRGKSRREMRRRVWSEVDRLITVKY